MLIVALLGRHRPGICNGIGTASKRILVFLVLAILTPPAQARQTEQARTQFECATTKVIMTNKAGPTNSVQVEEHMTFWIDNAAKTFIFSDGRRLRVTRFDKSWISASSEDIQYEFDRADRLSITHNSCADRGAQPDIGETGQAAPHHDVPRRRIIGAREVSA